MDAKVQAISDASQMPDSSAHVFEKLSLTADNETPVTTLTPESHHISKIGLLFLTYSNPNQTGAWLSKGYLYNPAVEIVVHAKYPDMLNEIWRPYCSRYLIETGWFSESLVVATLLLLEQAYLKDVDWFILCSEDSYPLLSCHEILKELQTQTISMFQPMKCQENTYKTSQWWILCRKDVELLLNNIHNSKLLDQNNTINNQINPILNETVYLQQLYHKQLFIDALKKLPQQRKSGAPDEYFFLTIFQLLYSYSYQYKQKTVHYVKWIQLHVAKHPTIFNKLLPIDNENIHKKRPYFIRKVLPTFENIVITPKEYAIVITIGSETGGRLDDCSRILQSIQSTHDIYLLVLIDDLSKIPQQLKDSCIQLFSLLWNVVDKVYPLIHTILPLTYHQVVIVKENDNINHINLYQTSSIPRDITSPPLNTSTELIALPTPQLQSTTTTTTTVLSPSFISCCDYNSQYKIAYLFLLREDLNHPKIWKNYFTKESQQYCNIYVHSKNPNKVMTPFLRDHIISDIRPTEWGYIVDAYFALFSEAIKNPNNLKFIIVSESCIPIYSFRDIKYYFDHHDYRLSLIKSMRISQYDRKCRIENQTGYQDIGIFIKHYARMCLSRYHVEKLLSQSPLKIDFFKRMHVGDEFFLTLLGCNPTQGEDFIIDQEITYDNWEAVHWEVKKLKEQIQRLQYEIQYKHDQNDSSKEHEIQRLQEYINEILKNPKTYDRIDNRDISNAFSKKAFFWRKFPSSIQLDAYYGRYGELKRLNGEK